MMAEEKIWMCSIALYAAIGRDLVTEVGEEIFSQLGFMNAFVKSLDFFGRERKMGSILSPKWGLRRQGESGSI